MPTGAPIVPIGQNSLATSLPLFLVALTAGASCVASAARAIDGEMDNAASSRGATWRNLIRLILMRAYSERRWAVEEAVMLRVRDSINVYRARGMLGAPVAFSGQRRHVPDGNVHWLSAEIA